MENESSATELDQIERDFELKFQQMRCYVNPDDVHFLSNPKMLPCEKNACFDCIKKNLNTQTHTFNCNLCRTAHVIEDMSQLKSNASLVDQFDLSSHDLDTELIEKLNAYVRNLKHSFQNKEELIEKMCEQTKKEIGERIDAVKAHLDVLHREMLDTLAKIKVNVCSEIERLNGQIDVRTSECQVFSENMQRMLDDFEQNKDTLEKDMYECQDFVEELKKFEQKFHAILRKVTFEPSEWQPDQSFVDAYIGKFKFMALNDANLSDTNEKSDLNL